MTLCNTCNQPFWLGSHAKLGDHHEIHVGWHRSSHLNICIFFLLHQCILLSLLQMRCHAGRWLYLHNLPTRLCNCRRRNCRRRRCRRRSGQLRCYWHTTASFAVAAPMVPFQLHCARAAAFHLPEVAHAAAPLPDISSSSSSSSSYYYYWSKLLIILLIENSKVETHRQAWPRCQQCIAMQPNRMMDWRTFANRETTCWQCKQEMSTAWLLLYITKRCIT